MSQHSLSYMYVSSQSGENLKKKLFLLIKKNILGGL